MVVLVNKVRLQADIQMKPFADKRSVEPHIRIDKLNETFYENCIKEPLIAA